MGSHIFENWVAVKWVTGTTSGVAGTRSDHAHGLGKDINMYRVLLFACSKGDDDTNDAAPVALVKTDATNITVKSSGTSIPFYALLLLAPTHVQTAGGIPAELR